ncbi:HEAT repeat domain-containing protein [Desulfococcaceae bacterium HSG9]|nr:HEAT repeat domain-containing protein [Desulfococcaceae bacterium HSG9]
MKQTCRLSVRVCQQRKVTRLAGLILLLGCIIGVFSVPTVFAKKMSDQQALAKNIADLNSTDLNTVSRAAALLGASADIRAVEPLVEALKNNDSMIQYSVSAALQKLGTLSVPAMIARLDSDNTEFVALLVENLGQIGDSQAVTPLCQLLSPKASYKVRMAVVKALGDIRDPLAIKSLIAVMKDKFSAERHLAMEPLVKIGASALEPLLAELKNDDPDVVRIAVAALVKIGDPRATESLIDVFKTTDSNAIRISLAAALGKIGDKKAIPALLAALNDEIPVVRKMAAASLAKIGKPAVNELVKILKNGDSPALRKSAASVLGKIGDVQAVAPLIAALEDFDIKVRINAAHALGQLYDESAVLPLIKLLHNYSPTLSKAAAKALVSLDDKAIPHLLNQLERDAANPNEPYKSALTANVLARTCTTAVEPLIELVHKADNATLHTLIADALAQIGKPVVEPLISELRQSNLAFRSPWENILARIGLPALAPVIELMESPDELQRRAAIAILGDMWEESAEAPLINALADWKNRKLAARGLNAMEWQPKFASERVHYYLATGQERTVLDDWKVNKQILLLDFKSGDMLRTEYAIQAFLRLGQENMTAEMIKIMKEEESRIIAQAFFECGDEPLRQAALKFMKR